MRKLLIGLLVLAIGAAGTYCLSEGAPRQLRRLLIPPTRIDVLLSNPSSYDGQSVKVTGDVTSSFGLMGFGAFRLRDSQTGSEILVVTSGAIPTSGTSLSIFGQFKQAVTIGPFQYAVIFVQD